MKRLLLIIAVFAMTTSVFTSCNKDPEQNTITTGTITLDKTASTYVGQTVTLKATSLNDNATYSWSSSDAKIATVESGIVTGIAKGVATITVKSGDQTADCVVTIDIFEGDVYVPLKGTITERLKAATVFGRKAVASVSTRRNNNFKENYEVEFIQPIDHKNPALGTFTQRVLLSIESLEEPVVFVTQGYGLGSGWSFQEDSYIEELAKELSCNQVVIEHRYFEESTPSPIDWNYHTIENQVNDLHSINLILRKIFKDQKFISTGRSKGGQTSIFYEAYFPNDIDIAVPYVAPICYQMNDMRHAEFLKNVGSESRRTAIKEFQQALFDRREEIIPHFKRNFDALDYSADIDVIYDLCVLEYSFMCWQYNPNSSIPSAIEPAYNMALYLVDKSPASYFSSKRDPSFIMNVAREAGYYGYDLSQFANTKITKEQCDRWIEDIVTPEDGRSLAFNPALGEKVKTFLKNNTTEKMIFIYGEYDTWSAAAVDKEFFEGKTNMFRYDRPRGDHSTFIEHLNNSSDIINQIKTWLEE